MGVLKEKNFIITKQDFNSRALKCLGVEKAMSPREALGKKLPDLVAKKDFDVNRVSSRRTEFIFDKLTIAVSRYVGRT